ncbi:YbjN domain-containing protein [Marinobacterium marinum]|uniref:YbjN domain-containing protein n=1 Tax=Marinobacterium marinum TaxID=2756129 RepID=A0A7W2AC79_9GAMM|nr:YbjN domain-containing protein [Marinobacterium marinum]MBA4503681.1 YbjN domain-containing protein [Marinobacterium marinum]
MKAIPIMLLTAGLCAANVQAASQVDATDPQQILELAKGFGSATLEEDDYGDPLITGRINGSKYGIYFYGCDDNRDCTDIQFSAAWSGYDITLEQINDWNLNKRYGKAYLDDDGDPTVELIVNLKYGVSRDNLDDTIDWWKLTMTEFEQFIDE